MNKSDIKSMLTGGKSSSVATQPEPPPEMRKKTLTTITAILVAAIAAVDWQNVDTFKVKTPRKKGVKAGDPRTVITGIPTDALKKIWRKNKVELKQIGFTLFPVSREKTGETKTVKGRTFEIVKKQWQARLTVNDNNKALATAIAIG